jgi:type IV pilus assembly protein PilQ
MSRVALLTLVAAFALVHSEAGRAAPGGGGAPRLGNEATRVRLVDVSSASSAGGAAVVIELSDPVAYVASRPDPFTVIVEMRDVAPSGANRRVTAAAPLSAVDVTQTTATDGEYVTQVTIGLTAPVPHRVKSTRNTIRVDFGSADDEVRLRADATPVRVPVASGSGRATPARNAMTATRLNAVRVVNRAPGTGIVLSGNGRLEARSIVQMTEAPLRLVLDFPGVAATAPPVTAGRIGQVERVRVAMHSRDPLVTRVVVDLTAPVSHRVAYTGPDGRDLEVVLEPHVPSTSNGHSAALFPEPPVSSAVPVATGPVVVPEPPPATVAGAPAVAAAPTAAEPQAQPAPPPPAPAPQTPAPQTPTTTGVGQQTPEKVYQGHPVNFDFQNANLRDVLRTFAEISGLNIVIDPAVQGTVDVSLKEVPWDQALDIILRANKLGYSVDGTVIRIAPLAVLREEQEERTKLAQAQALSGELRVMTKTLSYARAGETANLIRRSVLSQRGTIEVDERTNTLILTDLQDRLDTASNLIGTLDRPEPQVEIEARIVQTTREFARAIGVTWGVAGRVSPEQGNTTGVAFPNRGSLTGRVSGVNVPPDPRATSLEGTPSAVDLGVTGATTGVGILMGAVNGAFNLDMALSALERTGKGRVLSSPRVSTQNNRAAEVTQGIQIPIQTIANNTITVTFKDAALILKVTPQITAAGTVIMAISLENASPDFSRQVNGIPPIDTQRAVTQVQVSDGATTVIGGIFVSRENQVTDRTPMLHRIPLLGWLFRRDELRDESRELLIFITPRILKS